MALICDLLSDMAAGPYISALKNQDRARKARDLRRDIQYDLEHQPISRNNPHE
jgi:hypothetical protein